MHRDTISSGLSQDFLAGNFICEEGFNSWFVVDLPVYHCIFQKDYYEDSLFDNCGITFPKSLERSVTKRRAEHLAGRYCASRSLGRYGIYTGNIGIGKNRSPIWPPRMLGSISHCDRYAVAVSVPDEQVSGIGIDIETIVSDETATRLRDSIFTRDELPLLGDHHGSEGQIFSVVFSVKESFFKAVYPRVGYYFNFDAVTITDIDWKNGVVRFYMNYALSNVFMEGMEFSGMFRLLNRDTVATMVLIDRCI